MTGAKYCLLDAWLISVLAFYGLPPILRQPLILSPWTVGPPVSQMNRILRLNCSQIERELNSFSAGKNATPVSIASQGCGAERTAPELALLCR